MNVSLTHDLSDGDGLGQRGWGATPGDVDRHHSEQHLLSHWETLHPVVGLLHRLLIGLYPLVTCRLEKPEMSQRLS